MLHFPFREIVLEPLGEVALGPSRNLVRPTEVGRTKQTHSEGYLTSIIFRTNEPVGVDNRYKYRPLGNSEAAKVFV